MTIATNMAGQEPTSCSAETRVYGEKELRRRNARGADCRDRAAEAATEEIAEARKRYKELYESTKADFRGGRKGKGRRRAVHLGTSGTRAAHRQPACDARDARRSRQSKFYIALTDDIMRLSARARNEYDETRTTRTRPSTRRCSNAIEQAQKKVESRNPEQERPCSNMTT